MKESASVMGESCAGSKGGSDRAGQLPRANRRRASAGGWLVTVKIAPGEVPHKPILVEPACKHTGVARKSPLESASAFKQKPTVIKARTLPPRCRTPFNPYPRRRLTASNTAPAQSPLARFCLSCGRTAASSSGPNAPRCLGLARAAPRFPGKS